MRKLFTFLLACLFALVGCTSPSSSASQTGSSAPGPGASGAALPQNADSLAGMIELFACHSSPLVLAADENGCYSPAGLYFALALASVGAEGETLEEMLSVLHAGNDQNLYAAIGEMMAAVRALDAELQQALAEQEAGGSQSDPFGATVQDPQKPSRIAIANAAWLSDQYVLNEHFARIAQNEFLAEAFTVTFGEAATNQRMSQWVSDATNDLINPTIQTNPGELLYLMNTILYTDGWMDKFYETDNTTEPFTLPDGSTVDSTYMNRHTGERDYYVGEGFKGITLRLNQGSMTFILPEDGLGVDALFASADRLYSTLHPQIEYAEVILKLPKFSFDNEYPLVDSLRALGIQQAFDPSTADFPTLAQMADGTVAESPYISNVRQQTHIAVDEDGIEAAAYTEIAIATGAAPDPQTPPVVELFFDKPFMFYINVDILGDVPLFIGIVNNPLA